MNPARLTLVDKSTLVYNGIVVLLLLAFSSRVPRWHWLILINLGIIASILFVFSRVTPQSHSALRFLRCFYPMILISAVYMQTERMNRIFFKDFLDPYFQHVEYGLFGMKPAIAFAERFPQWWVNEYMHMTYFSYYLTFPILGLILYFRRNHEACDEFVFTLCSTFYVFYVIFIFLPVLGAETIGLPPSALDGPFTRLMKVIFDNCERGGAAFPSSHVGIAVLVLIFAFRHLSRKVAWVFAVFCVSLSFATVYCRYHYAIDAIAGLIAGIVLAYLFSAIAVRSRSKAALQPLTRRGNRE